MVCNLFSNAGSDSRAANAYMWATRQLAVYAQVCGKASSPASGRVPRVLSGTGKFAPETESDLNFVNSFLLLFSHPPPFTPTARRAAPASLTTCPFLLPRALFLQPLARERETP